MSELTSMEIVSLLAVTSRFKCIRCLETQFWLYCLGILYGVRTIHLETIRLRKVLVWLLVSKSGKSQLKIRLRGYLKIFVMKIDGRKIMLFTWVRFCMMLSYSESPPSIVPTTFVLYSEIADRKKRLGKREVSASLL